MRKLFGVLFALLLLATPALAQNAGTVAANAFAIGRGPNVQGYMSLLCGSAQLAVGQAAAPICRTINGDVSLSAAGTITLATVNSNVGSFGSATQCTSVTVNAKGLITAASQATCTPAVGSITGMGTNVPAWLITPSSANLRAAITDETGTGLAYFQGGDIGTPSAGNGSNLTNLNASQLAAGIVPNARLNATFVPNGRLTLVSGSPVMSVANTTAAGTMLFTPYNGNLVPIYDGTNFTPTVFTELSNVNANSATGSAGPAAVANNSCYDYFVWSNAGTPTLTRGPAWTNTSTRSAGTALARTSGVLLNSVSITNGPAANRGTYVGTACSNGTATFDWINGAGASGGTAAVFSIWNMYNRDKMSTTVSDTGTGYTYTSATIRQARASAGNQISFVAGLQEDGFTATMVGQVNTVAASGATAMWGVGLNSTSTFACGRTFGQAATAVVTVFGSSAVCNLMPALGLNVISANEASEGVNANTFDNNSLNNLSATLRN